jgi:hypothetical protein
MTSPGPTHSGCPFVGRSREIGILTHLLTEGLEGRLGLVRVAGSMGSGRRRLIAEALNHGPDVEWVHLAPGGAEADLTRWMRTELIDLLDTYPDAPVPSWALSAIEPFAPQIAMRSAIPALSRERIPPRDAPSILGRAIGAVLGALTGRTSVIVDAGLWPRTGALSVTLSALVAALHEPGTVLIAATDDSELWPDPAHERTLLLEPLDGDSVSQFTQHWKTGKHGDSFAAWLARVTNGHPFYIQETVRWLEELGHVRVHEDERRVEMLSPIERWPIPLSLEAVMEMRYRRLPPAALQILQLIAEEDGRVDLETLRRRLEDDDSFEEGMTWLRRRDFLRDRTTRRPLALASPRWRAIVRSNVLRLPPMTKSLVPTSEAPLARIVDRIDALASTQLSPDDLRREITEIARRLRGRRGAAWDGGRGRLAVHAARLRLSESRPHRALLWIRWGMHWTSAGVHPGLRRSLRSLEAEIHERLDDPERAATTRRQAFDDALASGHLLAATRLKPAVNETARRSGEAIETHLTRQLTERGMPSQIGLAAFTEVASLIDARDIAAARRALEDRPTLKRLSPWIERVDSESTKPLPLSDTIPRGWTWGLGNSSAWIRAIQQVEAALESDQADALLAHEQHLATRLGFLPLAADIAESRIWRGLRMSVPRRRTSNTADFDRILEDTAPALLALGSSPRVRALALRLRATDAADHPQFATIFAPHLLQEVSAPMPSFSLTLSLHFTGVPRVHQGGRAWPKALWPEWWGEMWGSAVSAALLGEPLDRDTLERRLRSKGHLPTEDFQDLLVLGNELFRGPERAAGGLALKNGTIIVDWSGFTIDVLTAWTSFDQADAEGGDAEQYAHGLDHIEGPYLSGLESPEVERARVRLQERVRRALEVCFDQNDVPPARWVRWLEGPVRMIGGREIAARFMESRGLAQAALALRHASP